MEGMPEESAAVERALAYHARTKHHLHRFAASPGYLDWATQPDPFRTFRGSERIALPLMAKTPGTSYGDLYDPQHAKPAPFDLHGIALLFELALGLSAWKEYGDSRWALRCNPSSGNLHPTEGYAILPAMEGLESGVFHYDVRGHSIERRSVSIDSGLIPESACLVGLSSIHWREAWKYGERAFRYCQHDMGHAIASVRYAAATLGWTARLLGDASDPEIASSLGLSREESFAGVAMEDREHPGALLLVGPDAGARPVDLAGTAEALRSGTWTGEARHLSPDHVAWPAIDEVARATWRGDHASAGPEGPMHGLSGYGRARQAADAAGLIKQRRSAVALDETTSIPVETFYGILDRLLPRPDVPPWDAWPWPPRVHLAVFVHRVDGLAPGLYLFERSEEVDAAMRPALRGDFAFERPRGCPPHLRLFRLASGDFRDTAQMVSCRQRIAGAGAFSLGMLAEFAADIESLGAWWYRRLFWEAGILGHVLYLEAEAAGVRGTGIGCYFDDAFHGLLGIVDPRFQSLYHFTVGGAVEDHRLMTRTGYYHIETDSEGRRAAF
jgi:SagB-type dehydrogenase family enzyme